MGAPKIINDPAKKLLLTKEEAAQYVGIDVSVINDYISLGKLKVCKLFGRSRQMINRVILEEFFYNLADYDPDPRKAQIYSKLMDE